MDRLNTIVDILCPARKAPSPVKRVIRRTVQPGEVAAVWPLTGETRKPEYLSQPQPVQKQKQSHKHVVQAEVHVLMEPPKPEVTIESQIPNEALDQVGHPPTPKDPIQGESEVPELQQLPTLLQQPKPMVLE